MKNRPIPVTVVGLLLVVTGALGFAFHLIEMNPRHPFQNGAVWIGLVSLIAVVCGVYLFRGRNWARWLAMLWIGFHVVVSAFHPFRELAIHILIFAAFAYFLFRPPATEYFRTGRVG